MFGPALTIALLKMKNLAPSGGKGSLVEVSLCALALYVSLPCAIAAFPQEGSLSRSELEEKFQNLKDSSGKEIETFYFNKGL